LLYKPEARLALDTRQTCGRGLMFDIVRKIIPNIAKDNVIYDMFAIFAYFILTQQFVTARTGPFYKRTPGLIEIDITYACNLSCFNCNRSCGLAPSHDRLSLEQIHRFIGESIAQGINWRRIRLLGGEPTLHPEFPKILDELLAFRTSQCPDATIEVWTNGFGKKVNDVLSRLGKDVVVCNSAKKSSKQCFQPFNLAPKDFVRYRYSDFSCGCWIISHCGMGLSPYGYYPCAVGAAIDRVLGFDIGRKSLPNLSDPMRDQMEVLCRYCGHFMTFRRKMIDRHLMSASWRKAYESYKLSKPRLTFY
jgi:hypothetical protein